MDPAAPNLFQTDKIIILIGLMIYWIIITLADILIAPTGNAQVVMFLLTAIGWGIGMLYWCTADARERGTELTYGQKIAVVALGLLAVIWYLFHSRGGHGGFKAIGWLLLYALVGFVVNMIVAAVVLMVLHVTGIRAIG